MLASANFRFRFSFHCQFWSLFCTTQRLVHLKRSRSTGKLCSWKQLQSIIEKLQKTSNTTTAWLRKHEDDWRNERRSDVRWKFLFPSKNNRFDDHEKNGVELCWSDDEFGFNATCDSALKVRAWQRRKKNSEKKAFERNCMEMSNHDSTSAP